MKCERCNGLDFDVVIPSLFGSAYIECSGCSQGYLVLDKLNLRPTELIGDVEDNTDNCVMMTCGKCKALRVVETSKGDSVKSTQVCNACVDYMVQLSPKDEDTIVEMAGGKISWEDFLSTAKTFD